MTGPHRNHVEARSSRRPARQYVSETHDHKPDAPRRTIQVGDHDPEFALQTARTHLITLGGDPRKLIAEMGSPSGDEMQAAILDLIDAALAPSKTLTDGDGV